MLLKATRVRMERRRARSRNHNLPPAAMQQLALGFLSNLLALCTAPCTAIVQIHFSRLPTRHRSGELNPNPCLFRCNPCLLDVLAAPSDTHVATQPRRRPSGARRIGGYCSARLPRAGAAPVGRHGGLEGCWKRPARGSRPAAMGRTDGAGAAAAAASGGWAAPRLCGQHGLAAVAAHRGHAGSDSSRAWQGQRHRRQTLQCPGRHCGSERGLARGKRRQRLQHVHGGSPG